VFANWIITMETRLRLVTSDGQREPGWRRSNSVPYTRHRPKTAGSLATSAPWSEARAHFRRRPDFA